MSDLVGVRDAQAARFDHIGAQTKTNCFVKTNQQKDVGAQQKRTHDN